MIIMSLISSILAAAISGDYATVTSLLASTRGQSLRGRDLCNLITIFSNNNIPMTPTNSVYTIVLADSRITVTEYNNLILSCLTVLDDMREKFKVDLERIVDPAVRLTVRKEQDAILRSASPRNDKLLCVLLEDPKKTLLSAESKTAINKAFSAAPYDLMCILTHA